VKFVANTIDAIAAAHAIFHLPIAGEYPEVILAEARYNPQQEIFLAILLDYHLQNQFYWVRVKGGWMWTVYWKPCKKWSSKRDFPPISVGN